MSCFIENFFKQTCWLKFNWMVCCTLTCGVFINYFWRKICIYPLPPNNLENHYPCRKLTFWKIKENAWNSINSHKCTMNDSNMMFGSWDRKHKRQNFCHFGLGFFAPSNSPKNHFFKEKEEKKNAWRYHFTHVYQKLWSHDVQFLRYAVRWIGRQMDEWMEKVT